MDDPMRKHFRWISTAEARDLGPPAAWKRFLGRHHVYLSVRPPHLLISGLQHMTAAPISSPENRTEVISRMQTMGSGTNTSLEFCPFIDVELSITPSTHNFTQPSPPILIMVSTSRATRPITFFTWDTPLHFNRLIERLPTTASPSLILQPTTL